MAVMAAPRRRAKARKASNSSATTSPMFPTGVATRSRAPPRAARPAKTIQSAARSHGASILAPNCCWLKGFESPKEDEASAAIFTYKVVRPTRGDHCPEFKDRKEFCSVNSEPGKERRGRDLSGIPQGKDNLQPTAEDCCSACIDNPNCRAFSWSPDQRCFLKGYKPEAVADAEFESKSLRNQEGESISGTELCASDFETGFFEGLDLVPAETNPKGSAEACCLSCAEDENCLAFSWRSDPGFPGLCWLKGKPESGGMDKDGSTRIRGEDGSPVVEEGYCAGKAGEGGDSGAADCCTACYDTPDCMSFDYRSGTEPTGECCRLQGGDGPILLDGIRKISFDIPAPQPCDDCGRKSDDVMAELILPSEDMIRVVADEATELYFNRAKNMAGCTPSVHACSGNPQGKFFQCAANVPNNRIACPSCKTCGRKASMDRSVVMTPPGTNPADLTGAVKESICAFQKIEETFRSGGTEQQQLSGIFIATIAGVQRKWPGTAQTRCKESDEYFPNCKSYDPRVTPWFVAASSGPKDVVLLIDTSSSMNLQLKTNAAFTRWDITRAALLRMVGTFGASDFINIVTFSSETKDLAGEKSRGGKGSLLVRGTKENLATLAAAINAIEPEGGTDFRLGFSAAFDVLIASVQEDQYVDVPPTSNCEKIIIFLTDGLDCTLNPNQICTFDGEQPVEENLREGVGLVLDFIDDKQKELEEVGGKRARIFAFSMTTDADARLPKMISCRNEGSWSPISETDDPLTKMNDYLRFISWNRRQFEPIWLDAHEEGGGSGLKTTVAAPVFSPDIPSPDGGGEIPGLLVAVVGLDIRIEELGDNAEVLVKTLASRINDCRPLSLTDCQFQILRGEEGECVQDFDREKCHFQPSEGHFYVPSSRRLPFKAAKEACEEMGGQLARIDSDDEQLLLAGLSPPEGSWIAMQKISNIWKWTTFTDSGNTVVSDKLQPRSRNDDGGGDERCATIDSRGPKDNIDSAFCDHRAHFICELEEPDSGETPEVCNGMGMAVEHDRNFNYTLRPIAKCKDLERAIGLETDVVKEAIALESAQVVAPIGKDNLTNEDVNCCCTILKPVDEMECTVGALYI